jgi:drug/metabolite transporter (DMT)-like permease
VDADERRRRLAGYAYMATGALTWGSLPVIIDRAGGHAVVLVALRMGFGAAALGVFLVLFGRADIVPPRGTRLRVAGLGVLLALNWVLFFRAVQLLGATAVLIGYLFPLLVALLAPVVVREPSGRYVLRLAAVGFAGLGTILAPQISGGRTTGAVLALGVAVAAAFLLMGARTVVARVHGPVIAFWENVVGVAVLLPWAVSLGGGDVPWAWGALIGVVHTAAAGILFFRSIGRVPAQEAGILMYLEPASAVLFVWGFQGVVPTPTDAVGGALVIAAGIGLVMASGRTGRSVAPEPGLVGPG